VLGFPNERPTPRGPGMPAFNFSDYSSLGNTEGWNPLFRNDQSLTFNTNASWMIRFSRDPVRFRLRPPSHEPLAAGIGRIPARRFSFAPALRP